MDDIWRLSLRNEVRTWIQLVRRSKNIEQLIVLSSYPSLDPHEVDIKTLNLFQKGMKTVVVDEVARSPIYPEQDKC
jgi:hypothetical protein